MTTTDESEGANDTHASPQRRRTAAMFREPVEPVRGSEERREFRTAQLRRITVTCGLVLALYLAAGAVFSSMGWNAWALLAGAWLVLVGFVALSD
jgi:fatty acid desaturase